MELDVVNKFRCRNSGRGIYKLTSFTLAHTKCYKVTTIPGAGCYGLGFLGNFCSVYAQELSSRCGTFPCGVGQCKTYKFIDSSTPISAPKFVYHIKHHFTCTSSHLIYCISCSRCGMLYIGETGRCLRTRFGDHRRAVTSNDANQLVARHFNNGSHCVSDMKFRALCPISGSNDSRKRHEMRLFSKLGTVHPLGINERFSYI